MTHAFDVSKLMHSAQRRFYRNAGADAQQVYREGWYAMFEGAKLSENKYQMFGKLNAEYGSIWESGWQAAMKAEQNAKEKT